MSRIVVEGPFEPVDSYEVGRTQPRIQHVYARPVPPQPRQPRKPARFPGWLRAIGRELEWWLAMVAVCLVMGALAALLFLVANGLPGAPVVP